MVKELENGVKVSQYAIIHDVCNICYKFRLTEHSMVIITAGIMVIITDGITSIAGTIQRVYFIQFSWEGNFKLFTIKCQFVWLR